MDYAYSIADLVVSRAGASSISELCLLAKPVILIPSPNVAEDHQTKNALALVEKNAALMIEDISAKSKLVFSVAELIQDDKRLRELSQNIVLLAQENSAKRIVAEVTKIVTVSK
jgi:UDP-N-acetylglucosamine--N-acetylmuramyl-(pentapeptide) pyrophosphoryl-undecaprenol N-acetylglucosamine transferase